MKKTRIIFEQTLITYSYLLLGKFLCMYNEQKVLSSWKTLINSEEFLLLLYIRYSWSRFASLMST